jgi:hypothetical protein
MKKEDENEDYKAEDNTSLKWMPSKKRIIHKMMEDQRSSKNKFEKEKLLGYDDNSSNNNSSNNNITIRVCSDCHTTKTPLWRSGPTGPKVHIAHGFIIL